MTGAALISDFIRCSRLVRSERERSDTAEENGLASEILESGAPEG